ncbi:MAG TPA: hypothetical protein VN841_25650 [Bryobacteraceae bacterium]|nr:hypothetical protein [Bryobacteraceae bacterium]
MKSFVTLTVVAWVFACFPAPAADPIDQMHDADVQRIEREILPLVEAMPAFPRA